MPKSLLDDLLVIANFTAKVAVPIGASPSETSQNVSIQESGSRGFLGRPGNGERAGG